MPGVRAGAAALLVAVGGVAVPVALAPPASACSCMAFSTEAEVRDQLRRIPGVFVGTPVDRRETGSAVSYEFEVDRVYAGEVGGRTVVSTPASSAACGTGFAMGVDQVVLVSDRGLEFVGGRGPWHADMCTNGVFELRDGPPLDARAVVERELGVGHPPDGREVTLAGQRARRVAGPVIAVAGLVALIGAGVGIRRWWHTRRG